MCIASLPQHCPTAPSQGVASIILQTPVLSGYHRPIISRITPTPQPQLNVTQVIYASNGKLLSKRRYPPNKYSICTTTLLIAMNTYPHSHRYIKVFLSPGIPPKTPTLCTPHPPTLRRYLPTLTTVSYDCTICTYICCTNLIIKYLSTYRCTYLPM